MVLQFQRTLMGLKERFMNLAYYNKRFVFALPVVGLGPRCRSASQATRYLQLDNR